MNKLNILILGKGYVGNHLHNHLKNDFNVIIHSSEEMDYHNPKTLYKFLLNNEIDTVINCSGFTGRPNIDEAEMKKDLCWMLNTSSPLRVNTTCNMADVNYLHVSSGCVYDGYEKVWDEEDAPNYGLFCNRASFYSKSKHAFENLSKTMDSVILRVRMPFHYESSGRNYLDKIRQYNDLINFRNSKTYIPDFCEFVKNLLVKKVGKWKGQDIYNVINPGALTTQEVCDIMREYGFHNDNWKFVYLADLSIAAGRSNCVMDGSKSKEIYEMRFEKDVMKECFDKMLENQAEDKRIKNEIEEKYARDED
jgi:dTDP-4-dehydrorhamnose reductase